MSWNRFFEFHVVSTFRMEFLRLSENYISPELILRRFFTSEQNHSLKIFTEILQLMLEV